MDQTELLKLDQLYVYHFVIISFKSVNNKLWKDTDKQSGRKTSATTKIVEDIETEKECASYEKIDPQ